MVWILGSANSPSTIKSIESSEPTRLLALAQVLPLCVTGSTEPLVKSQSTQGLRIHNRHAALPRRFSTRDLRQRKERWHRANLASTRFYVAPRLKKNRYVQLRFVVQAQQRGRRISCCVLRSRAKITLSWPNVSNLSASRTHMILGPRLPILEINLQRKASNEAWQLIHRGESG